MKKCEDPGVWACIVLLAICGMGLNIQSCSNGKKIDAIYKHMKDGIKIERVEVAR